MVAIARSWDQLESGIVCLKTGSGNIADSAYAPSTTESNLTICRPYAKIKSFYTKIFIHKIILPQYFAFTFSQKLN